MNKSYTSQPLCRPPPRMVGVDILFYKCLRPHPRQRPHHTITNEPLLKFFLGGMFFVPQGISFDFCYDLDLCSQGQAVRAFFIRMVFPNFFKSTWGILIKHVRKLYRQVAHDQIMLDLLLHIV